MEKLSNINYYQSRRRLVLDILEEKPLNLRSLKDTYKQKQGADMPFTDKDDRAVHEWLLSIDSVTCEIKGNDRIYSIKKPDLEEVKAIRNDNKRKTSSPIVSNVSKRSRSAPENEKENHSSQNNCKVRQARSVQFREQPNIRQNYIKTRSKSENRPSKLLGAPHMYGTLLVGDDFILGLAIYKLGFNATKYRGRLQSGFCVSGMTISEAADKIIEIDDDRYKTAIIYIGSVDIAADRELIQMMQDFTGLMQACGAKNIRPILCTLVTLPNYWLGNRKDTLNGFNQYITNNPFGVPVIDVNKCFRVDEKDDFNPYYFVDTPRYVSGFNKMLVLWSKEGRERVYDMFMKNMGMALVAPGNVTFSYI